MRTGLAEIINAADTLSTKEEKIAYLHKHASKQLMQVFRYAFDPNLKFLIPQRVYYTPNDSIDLQGLLYKEMRRMYLFIEGGHLRLSQKRREELFTILLNEVDPADAELLLALRDKELPAKTITKELVEEAFPGFETVDLD